MKLFDLGSCETVLLFPKVNESGIADVVVVRLFDVVLVLLLKPVILIDGEVLTGNVD